MQNFRRLIVRLLGVLRVPNTASTGAVERSVFEATTEL